MTETADRPPVTAEELEQLVDVWRSRLRLDAWRITLDLETPPEDPLSDAEVERASDYRTARIYFRADWASRPANRWGSRFDVAVEEIVVHELLHLLEQPIDVVVRGFVLERLAPDSRELALGAYTSALELVVDELSRVLVRAYAPELCPASLRTIPPTS